MSSFQKDVKSVLEAREYILRANKIVLLSCHNATVLEDKVPQIILLYLHNVSSKTFLSLNNGLCPEILTAYKWVPDSQWIRTQRQARLRS
jgi:hypothetical protein